MKNTDQDSTGTAAVPATINPESHATYWQENHAAQPYAADGGSHEEYRAAYHTGYTGAQEHGASKTFADVKDTLKGTYEQAKDSTSVSWDKAQHATQAAYNKAAEEIQIILHEERLLVGKREVSGGNVQLRKTIHSEQVNVPVELHHDDVTIERVAVGDVRDASTVGSFQEETIDVPLTREEAVVSKEAHVTGAVRLNKTSTSETQMVSDTVRKEDVEVIRDGKTEVKTDQPEGR